MVETRWATITTVASRGDGRQRGAQPGVGGEVERRERVVEQVDLGLADQRPGDREPLPLAAGDVRAALRDRRVEAARASPRRSRAAWATSSASHSSSSVASGLAVAQVARDGAGEQVRPSAARARSGARARRGRGRARRRRRPSTAPPVTSNSRGISDEQRGLAAPVLPMIAVVCPARRRKRDVAQHRRRRRPGSGTRRRANSSSPRVGDVGDRLGRRRRTDDSVSSTSLMRSAQTAARGTMIAMKVAIITDIRICIR